MPQYLDDNGDPIKSPAKVYLDDSGNPIGQPAPRATGTLSAAPKPSWLDDLENDLREGGTRTVVGRTLGRLQGRGDKGYTGLESGVSKGAADFVGSPELGAVETAKGIAKMKDHPASGAWDAVRGLAHMTEIPGMVVGGPAAEEAPAAIAKVIEKLPTAARGAKRLNEVEQVAGELPVNLARTSEHLMRASDLAERGASLPSPVKKLLKAYNRDEPLDYSTARDFYSNLSHLSAKDNMALTPSMRRQVALIVHALKDDIGETAAQVDQAAKYYAGMKDYARAMKAARIYNAITKALKSKAIQTAVGAGAGYAAAKAIGKEVGMKPANELFPPGNGGDTTSLPAPLQRELESAKIVRGAPTSTYGGMKDIATYEPGSSEIVVRDPSRFQPQVLGHELTHKWQASLPAPLRARMPADDPRNPYMKPEELYGLPDQWKAGKRFIDLPSEKQAQISQAWVAYHNSPEMRKILKPWIDDMNKYPQSVVMPTDPDQKGINTAVRAPAAPDYAFGNPTDAWQAGH